MKKPNMLLCLLLLVVSSGCATILSGTSQQVNVLSNPPGLIVTVDDEIQVRTPALITLRSNVPHIFTATMGDKIRTDIIETYFTPTTCLNVLFSPLIGTLIDIFSGATIQLETDRVLLDFTRPQPPIMEENYYEN
jgi:hypothetical protein